LKLSVYCAGLLALASVAFAEQNGGIVREGEYWVEKVAGSTSALGVEVLQVYVRGKVTLQGSSDDRISYVITRRVRARDIESARRTFSTQLLRVSRNAATTILLLDEPPLSQVQVEVTLSAPSAIRHSMVNTRSGDVEVVGMRGTVQAESGDGGVFADRLQSAFHCRTAGGRIKLGRIDGPVRCITGGGGIQAWRLGNESWLETGAGEIIVDQVLGPLHASSGAGNVFVTKAGSTVVARTLGGVIRVLDARGAVEADNAGGGIQINAAKDVRLEAVAGPIRLFGVSGELKASTAIGNILAELMGGRLLDSYLATGSGDITVLIPSNLAVRIQAFHEAGTRPVNVMSEFPEIRVVPGGAVGNSRLIASGDLNGGGPLLRIAASGGTVYLRRQK